MKTEIVQLKTSWGGVIQEALAFGTYISIFLFKQKTAYEMRISDWSSDVCSSDLHAVVHSGVHAGGAGRPTVRAARLHQDLCDRSEERRVGKECVSTCRSRWSPYH